MSAYQDYKYTRKLFDDAIALKEGDRVPLIGSVFSWAIVWSQYKLSEALHDFDKLYEVYYNYARDFGHDAVADIGLRNPIKFSEALGGEAYHINDEDGFVNYVEKIDMVDSEYDDFINNPRAYVINVLLPRKLKAFQGTKQEAKTAIKKAAYELTRAGTYKEKIEKAIRDDFGVLTIGDYYDLPVFENLINGYRGLKGALTDVRRHPDKVERALEALRQLTPPNIAPQPEYPHAMDIYVAIVGGYMLNKQQFGRFEWPDLEKTVDDAAKAGKTVYIFAEGNTEHLYDYFVQIPKGTSVIHFEQNDLRKAKKVLGNNTCICGGIPNSLLSKGTKEECIEAAKSLLDDLAPGGGFIFSQEKMMSYKADGRPENMKAVNEFVREYGKYHQGGMTYGENH